MKVRFFTAGTKYKLPNKRRIALALDNISSTEGKKFKELNIILCSDESIQGINNEFLRHDYPTDVISFTYAGEAPNEIYIGVEQARRQSKAFKVSLEKELHRLIVHGLLHICGYEDSTPEEKGHMTDLENEYLALHFAFN